MITMSKNGHVQVNDLSKTDSQSIALLNCPGGASSEKGCSLKLSEVINLLLLPITSIHYPANR